MFYRVCRRFIDIFLTLWLTDIEEEKHGYLSKMLKLKSIFVQGCLGVTLVLSACATLPFGYLVLGIGEPSVEFSSGVSAHFMMLGKKIMITVPEKMADAGVKDVYGHQVYSTHNKQYQIVCENNGQKISYR